ncbi:uncharacterized protein LOC101846282 [Aplysia californica]|uniref:Uncharacterized protein LOC101846282 n=1 Tax=Aplysia californica TaxID=6500 RepID=A0ABM0JM05_APLCA|nr:uncharacterized protein LOC101846282 [Aplysia californica]
MVEFHVLQCADCNTFQVLQVTKTNKWKCKLCGSKQSVRKVYGRGTGADCRRHVQKLNTVRGHVDQELCDLRLERANNATVDSAEFHGTSGEYEWPKSGKNEQISKWSQFVESGKEEDLETEDQGIEEYSGSTGLVTTDWTELQGHRKQQLGLKRKRSGPPHVTAKQQKSQHSFETTPTSRDFWLPQSFSQVTAKASHGGLMSNRRVCSSVGLHTAVKSVGSVFNSSLELGADCDDSRVSHSATAVPDVIEQSNVSIRVRSLWALENGGSSQGLVKPVRNNTVSINKNNLLESEPQKNISTFHPKNDSTPSKSSDSFANSASRARDPTSLNTSRQFSTGNVKNGIPLNALNPISKSGKTENIKSVTGGNSKRKVQQVAASSKWGAFLDEDNSDGDDSDCNSDLGEVDGENGALYINVKDPNLLYKKSGSHLLSPAVDATNHLQEDSNDPSLIETPTLAQVSLPCSKQPPWLLKAVTVSESDPSTEDTGSFQLGFSLDDDL